MAVIQETSDVLHRIRVKLYPNYLKNVAGRYIARTDSEASLTVKEVCSALKERGGFTGRFDDLVDHVEEFFHEMAYQLCDGYAVNTGFFTVYANVGGTFDQENETADKKKHPITFRFRTLAALKSLASHITVDVEGKADVDGYIGEFYDVTNETADSLAARGGEFIITGHKIKIEGEDPAAGLYFVPEEGGAETKLEGHLAVNTPGKLIGIIPAGMEPGPCRIRVITQYAGSGTITLKNPRQIEGPFVITVV